MNSLERVNASLLFEKTDRIPVIPQLVGITARMINKSIREYVTTGELLAESQLAAQKFFQYDAVFAFADLCVEAEAAGCEIVYSENNYPYVKQPALQTIAEIESLPIPDPHKCGRMPELLKAVTIMKERCRDRIPVVAHVLGPLTIASRLLGLEKMLYLSVDDPAGFKKLLLYSTQVAITFLKGLVEAGADCILMFNPSSSPSVLPVNTFREFELPNIKKIFTTIKGLDQKIITDLEGIDLDIFTVDYLVPLEVAFNLSKNLCFNGNIKPFSFVDENPADVYSRSLFLLTKALDRGGFILGSGCEVPPNARFDTIMALIQASKNRAKKYKTYGKKRNGKRLVTVFPSQKKIYVEEGVNLMDVLKTAEIFIPNLCFNAGTCGSCLVKIGKGVSRYTKKEKILLHEDQKKNRCHLACQFIVLSDMDIFIPKQSRPEYEQSTYLKDILIPTLEQKLRDEYPFASEITAVPFALTGRSGDMRPTLEILRSAIKKNIMIPMEQLGKIPALLKEDKKELFCIIDSNNRILDFSNQHHLLGAAVDMGTSIIAVYIHDLTTGKFITSGSILNPQMYYGDNIMTRAERSINDTLTLNKLREQLIDGINRIIVKISRAADFDHSRIFKVVLVGNTVMHHLFLGLDLRYLVRFPFLPVLTSAYRYMNKDTIPQGKLGIHDNGSIYLPPLISGLIGSDTVAGILASGLYKSKKIVLYVDLGTNGEVVIGNKDRILATSVAAGPAFERSHIPGGNIAGSNIIYSADIDEEFTVHYKTIDGRKPSGFYGSALIDIIASFIKRGLIDHKGHFIENPRCRNLIEGTFILVPKQETALFNPIVIQKTDIEDTQKAKGAISAAITILLNEFGITPDRLDRVILTGSFGITINVDNAILIGLLPKEAADKVEFIPNAAGIGARLYLISPRAAKDIDKIAKKVEYINVAAYDGFNTLFIDSMFFNNGV